MADSLTVHTFIVDLPEQFTPDMSGSTPKETAGWGWFSRKEVSDLPLQPDFEDTWESVDWENLKKSAVVDILKAGPHGYTHGWVYVGPPIAWGETHDITHPEHGHGAVIGTDKLHNVANVRFDDGKTRQYNAEFDSKARPHFETSGSPGEPLTGASVGVAVPGKYHVDDRISEDDPVSSAIKMYTMNSYMHINRMLRLNHGSLSKIRSNYDPAENKPGQTASYIEAIDTAMSKSAMTHPVTTMRGVSEGRQALGPAWRNDSSMKGTSWIDDGFVSTSTDPGIAGSFIMPGSGALLLNITTPAGIHGIVTGGQTEQELLLDRGLKYTVTGDSVKSGESGVRELDVTVSHP